MQEGPRQPQPLPLPAGESVSQLAHRGIVTLRQRHNEIMHRRFLTGGLDFLVGGVQFGDPQVVFDAVVKQMGFLGDKTFHVPKICRVNIRNPCAGKRYAAFLHVPEAHEQLEQRGFSAAAAPHNADHTVFRYLHRHIGQDGFAPVGKGNVLRRRARESDFRPAGNFLHDRGFVQNIQYPITCRKGVLKRTAQCRQSDHRAKGRKQRQRRDQNAFKAHRSALAEQGGDKQHDQVKGQYHRVGYCRIAAGGAFHPFLVFGKAIGFFIHLCQPLFTLPILQGF